MAEYIERNKVLDELNSIATDYIKDGSIQCSIAAGVVINIRDDVILKQPTADVVPVVRCKDCEYGNIHTDCHGRKYYGCDLNIDIGEVREVEPTDYCSHGERRCSDG
jgi:hypothetical protein